MLPGWTKTSGLSSYYGKQSASYGRQGHSGSTGARGLPASPLRVHLIGQFLTLPITFTEIT
jgi:hypothetical protein